MVLSVNVELAHAQFPVQDEVKAIPRVCLRPDIEELCCAPLRIDLDVVVITETEENRRLSPINLHKSVAIKLTFLIVEA